jgi:opacity protein-like surface antigen
MKKLFVLSVVFALLASAAFAVDVSGAVYGKVVPIQGDTGEGSKVTADGDLPRVRVEASGQTGDGVFGGWVRVEPTKFESAAKMEPTAPKIKDVILSGIQGNAWWQPIDQFRLLIGGNGDGLFGADGVARWNFYQTVGDVGVVPEGWAFDASFFGGWGAKGALLTITPMEALAINIAVPFISNAGKEAKDVYMKTNAQIAYTLSGIGKFALTYVGGVGDKVDVFFESDPTAAGSAADANALIDKVEGNGGKLYAYFGLSMIENLDIDIGFGYTLPVSTDKMGIKIKNGTTKEYEEPAGTIPDQKGTYNAPIAVGLGINYSAGAIGAKLRVQGKFAESAKPDQGETWNGPMVITADLLPSYAINDSLKFLLSAGLKMTMPDKGDTVVGWHVQPYVSVRDMFFAGLRIDSAGKPASGGDAVINWSVPVGLAVSF